jgi:hypothetical protein
MYKLANGWTKEKVMQQIKKYNSGTKAKIPGCFGCSYQTPYGNRCAIGCFIPDGHPGLKSGSLVNDLLEVYPELKDKMPFRSMRALRAFQITHDSCKGSVYDAVDKFLTTKCED